MPKGGKMLNIIRRESIIGNAMSSPGIVLGRAILIPLKKWERIRDKHIKLIEQLDDATVEIQNLLATYLVTYEKKDVESLYKILQPKLNEYYILTEKAQRSVPSEVGNALDLYKKETNKNVIIWYKKNMGDICYQTERRVPFLDQGLDGEGMKAYKALRQELEKNYKKADSLFYNMKF